MKTTFKTLASFAVLAFFLLIAWATSYEDDFIEPAFVEVLIKNQSDSCTVNGLELTYRVRRDNIDTLNLNGFEIVPSDSLYLFEEAFKYLKLHYTCNCPGNVFSQEVAVQIDSFAINEIVLDCD